MLMNQYVKTLLLRNVWAITRVLLRRLFLELPNKKGNKHRNNAAQFVTTVNMLFCLICHTRYQAHVWQPIKQFPRIIALFRSWWWRHECIIGPESWGHLKGTFNTLAPRQNGRYFPDNILKWIFLNSSALILTKFHWNLFLCVQLTIFQR